MTEKEKMQQGLLYDANTDAELLRERNHCKDLCWQLNQLRPSESEKQREILLKLLGTVQERVCITAPFYCDYGKNIHLGEDFYVNHNCVILDAAPVIFGNHVFIAPHCGFYTAGHPLNQEDRNLGLEYAYPIVVGNNVWIGAHTAVLPGVTIGDNSIIGAGSVVNRDIPAGVIAAGNPCRVIRTITAEDRKKYQR